MRDDLGDRMKVYEGAESKRTFMKGIPIMARIDGRCFSQLTKPLERPFDSGFANLMVATATYLTRQTVACCGYTQSDEISLTWHPTGPKEEMFFGGRIQKMVSALAAMATAFFKDNMDCYFTPDFIRNARLPTFDCRCWQVPNRTEGANTFLWREMDAAKNSVSMAARHYYDPRELEGKSGAQMQEMLFQKGVNWNDYSPHYKRGTFVRRVIIERCFSAEEIAKLPETHAARKYPDMLVTRSHYGCVDMPSFAKVVNREQVVYEGADPRTTDHETRAFLAS